MNQKWTICVRYTAHPCMIATAPYSALYMYIGAYPSAVAAPSPGPLPGNYFK